MTWAMATAMRLAGGDEGKGKGGMGNEDGDVRVNDKEGKGRKVTETVTRMVGKWTVMATKRAMAT